LSDATLNRLLLFFNPIKTELLLMEFDLGSENMDIYCGLLDL
jgi:hypothetical protein